MKKAAVHVLFELRPLNSPAEGLKTHTQNLKDAAAADRTQCAVKGPPDLGNMIGHFFKVLIIDADFRELRRQADGFEEFGCFSIAFERLS